MIKWRYCRIAEKDHSNNQRQYAHTYHYPNTICTCKALWKLPKSHRDGILLHEIGHLMTGADSTENEANRAIEQATGEKIDYVHSPYGDDLEWVRRNKHR